jgi:hypothetical protein
VVNDVLIARLLCGPILVSPVGSVPHPDPVVPRQNWCIPSVVLLPGSCEEEVMPDLSVQWQGNSHSSTCPPLTGCEVDAVVTVTRQPGTRLGKTYTATTIEHHVQTTGCGTSKMIDQPIYDTTPLELNCICQIFGACSPCEPLPQ